MKNLIKQFYNESKYCENSIVYLGTKEDDVFKVYFTPLGSDVNMWDEIYNPFSFYYRDIQKNDDYLLLMIVTPKFYRFTLSDYYLDMIGKTLNINDKGKASISFPNYINFDDFKITNVHTWNGQYKHNKDVLLSYSIDGNRVYVSILNSLNTHSGSSNYQCNHIFIITEKNYDNSIFKLISYLSSDGFIN